MTAEYILTAFDHRGSTEGEPPIIRKSLLRYRPEDIPVAIGVVLVDLLINHPSTDVDADGLPDLIEYLNGFFPRPPFCSAENSSKIRAAKAEGYSHLTKHQMQAVLFWLRMAINWNCFILRQDQIAEAIEFWEQFVSRVSPHMGVRRTWGSNHRI